MKAQKTDTEMQIYFQQKRKRKINKTATRISGAQQRQCQFHTKNKNSYPSWSGLSSSWRLFRVDTAG